MSDILFSSAHHIVQGIKSKRFSAVEVMQEHLNRVNKVNPKLNAIVQQIPHHEAIEQAKKADAMIAKGEKLGKLHGLPITIKDSLQVKGFASSAGCEGMKMGTAKEEGTAVARLRNEGAIIIGLTNVPELLLCVETDNKLYGQTKNPYDLKRTPGGSSGGEASIIAAGGSPLGLATDAGGSIRIPASFSGITGIKPTQGRIPITGGTLGDAPGIYTKLASLGPMARYVDDLFLELEIVAGVDGRDPFAVPVPLKNPKEVDLKALKVAFFTDNGYAKPTAEIQKVVKEAAESLKGHTASVTEQCPEILAKTVKLIWETIFLGGDRGMGLKFFLDYINVKEPSPLLQEFLQLADKVEFSVSELRNRFIEMDRFQIEMMKFMEPYDVLITPVAATTAKLHGRALKEVDDFSYTMSHNLTGWPAAVVRCGTSKDGLPIGVQIIAKPWRDDVALAVAKKLETLHGGFIAPKL